MEIEIRKSFIIILLMCVVSPAFLQSNDGAIVETVKRLEEEIKKTNAVHEHYIKMNSQIHLDIILEMQKTNKVNADQTLEIHQLKTSMNNIETQPKSGGVSYIRWGRTTCSGASTLVYRGYVGGAHYLQKGSGANYVCLPENPQWGNYMNGFQTYMARMYGTEYESAHYEPIFSKSNNNGNSLHDHDAPCAVCLASNRSSQLMIPARRECPYGWTMEYRGYLVAEYYDHNRGEFICFDEAPEVLNGGVESKNGALFYPVEAVCGSLHCPPYVNGWELTCVVCSK